MRFNTCFPGYEVLLLYILKNVEQYGESTGEVHSGLRFGLDPVPERVVAVASGFWRAEGKFY